MFAMAFVTLSLFYNPVLTSEWLELTEVKIPTFDLIFRHILTLLPFVIKDCVVMFHRDVQNPSYFLFSVILEIALAEHTYCHHVVDMMEIVLYWQPCSNCFC